MNRRIVWAVCLACVLPFTAAAQTPRVTEPQIPLREGLSIVAAYRNADGDYETIRTITHADTKSITVALSTDEAAEACRGNEPTANRRPRSAGVRTVLREDLESAHAYRQEFAPCASAPEVHEGTTAVGVSASVVRELIARGEAALSATTAAAGMIPGTLTRLETVPFNVIVNDERAELPALHVRWRSSAGEREYWILNDVANPLVLRASYMGKPFLQVVKLSFPAGDSTAAPRLERLLSQEGRAVLYGIYFDSTSDRIREESAPVLAGIARLLERNPAWSLAIEGYTDNLGGDEYNTDLSKRRANAVKVALVSRYQIAAGRLRATGHGARQPKDTNETLEGRARNRRVELVKSGQP